MLGGFAPSFQCRRRDRLVVKCHNKPSPVRGDIFHAQKLSCAPAQVLEVVSVVVRQWFCGAGRGGE